MKLKKDKNVNKQITNGSSETNSPPSLKTKKKKLKTQLAKEPSDNADPPSKPQAVEKPKAESLIKSVDTSIFQYFKELSNENEQKRREAALQLLQQLTKTKDKEKQKKELTYTLKRLIRGCGASTNVSRSGFYTGLVALLKAYKTEDLPLNVLFETLEKELHVGSSLTNKEDSDAVVGRILSCAAILHAGRIQNINEADLETLTNILFSSTRHKNYHVSLGYSFIAEIIEQVNEEQFKVSVWPLMQKEISKPWPKQTIQTIHCAILAKNKFPKVVNTKFMKCTFGGAEILNEESYSSLYKIFWEHTNIDILAHPAIEEFGKCIAKCSKLVDFWENTVNVHLEKSPTKLKELITLKVATDILNALNEEKTVEVTQLLSDNFVKMLVEGLKTIKQRKDETIKAFYTEFLEALVGCCSKLKDDLKRVEVIKRLILKPGIFDIEKYTTTRIIHQIINQLSQEGVQEIYSLYNNIFLNSLQKTKENTESWSQFERLNAGYMLQHLLHHKNVQKSFKWRQQQLQSLLTFGVFYVDNNFQVCQKGQQSSFSEHFGEQCKNMFFTSLQSKYLDLKEDQRLLFKLASTCNKHLQQEKCHKLVRVKNFNNSTLDAWNRMFNTVSSSPLLSKKQKDLNSGKEDSDNLQVIFNILLLNMGLQLFKEPEMAIPSIDDLLKCMDRTNKKQKEKKKKDSSEDNEEPEWIEVVVDLLLHLLSQNSSSLRQIVDGLFSHLCSSLNLNAVHHILSMLDMKDGKNPLSSKAEEEESENEESEDGESSDDESSEAEEENDESNSEDGDEEQDDDEEDDDDDEEDEDDDEEDEDVSNADKLRNAISQALIDSGTGLADKDDDMESIDLNDMTEEEGRKLDEALANAFKAMKKSPNGNQSKKSKIYRVQTTTVMHFRIRVLDLIEIYLQKNPSLMMVTEIMLSVFNMLEFCVSEELKPLLTKVEKLLQKLSQMKSNALEIDLQEDNIVDFIRILVEKKTIASAYSTTNKIRNKCVVFLIQSSIRACKNEKPQKIINLFQEYVQDFIKHRNPTVNITLLTEVFKLRWENVWDIALELTKTAFTKDTRGFRRLQTYDLLCTLYRNVELHRLNPEKTSKFLSKIEKSIKAFLILLTDGCDQVRQTPKEFQSLLEYLMCVQKTHQRLKSESILCSDDTCKSIQEIRERLRLENFAIYQRYCLAFKLTAIKNHDLQNIQQNGHIDTTSLESDDEKNALNSVNIETKQNNSEAAPDDSNTKPLKKRKASSESMKDLRKQKKQKKQLRLEASSRGLFDYNFVQTNGASEEGPDDEDRES